MLLADRVGRITIHHRWMHLSLMTRRLGQVLILSGDKSKVCLKCVTVLSRWQDTFKSFVKQGSELKKHEPINPYPKHSDIPPYLNAQNEWLRNNVFDAMGNYLFCAKCICAAFHASPQRIARQRAIKRNQFQSPTKELSNAHVEEQRSGKYVVMPVGCDVNFTQWWRSLGSSELVVIRYPHEKHGNACRVSNSAKYNELLYFIHWCQQSTKWQICWIAWSYILFHFKICNHPDPKKECLWLWGACLEVCGGRVLSNTPAPSLVSSLALHHSYHCLQYK